MVVILILPSSNEQHQQQQTPPTSTSIQGCDQFRLNGARIINNNHSHQHHEYRNRKRTSAPKRITFQTEPINQQRSVGVPSAAAYTASTTATTSKNYVRHITRVNISDVYSQIEIDGDVEPVTKEEEVVTKKKTELTTTRQIETRVKRQIVLEDGKVIEDSGPIVETNTTEDTNKQESESVERLKPGEDDVDGPRAIEALSSDTDQTVIKYVSDDNKDNIDEHTATVLAPRADGLVREMTTKKVVSREEIQERTETEDVKHFGDFTDEAYVNAINSGVENIQEALLSPEAQKQLIPTGPRLIHHSTKARKTIDTEDTDLKYSAQPDGTLVTEKRQTTEHEEFHDDELPEEDDHSAGSRERIEQTESSQRFSKRRDEQEVEYVADGKTIGKEMRYLAETEDIERDGPQEDASDWDSLSDRVRKARRQQKSLLQQHREAFLERERKERAIDFEKEEETRKDETIKWLESHFGSEGRSPDSTEEESEKKESFFNITIKSNQPKTPDEARPTLTNGVYHSNIKPKDAPKPQKYFQGISGWSERKETTPRKFATKTFQDELKGTLERNRLRNVASREDLISNRYKEDIVKSDDDTRKKPIKTDIRYGSRGDLKTQKEDLGYMSGSRTDIRPRHDSKEDLYAKSKKQQSSYLHREDSGYVKGSTEDLRYIRNTPVREDSFIRDSGEEEKLYKDPIKYNTSAIQRDDSAYVSSSTYFTEPRSPKTVPLCTPDSGIRSPSPEHYDPDPVRPAVPQRKRDKKMRIIETAREFEPNHREPEPDYSPPVRSNRSRSISPVPSPTTHYRSNPKKMYQKTRFASSSELSRPISTQTIETQTPPIKKTTMGATISNSIRKLVGKIRSASVDRKLKSKAKRSMSPQSSKQSSKHQQQQPFNRVNGGSTYQQYNVIDNHIGQASMSPAPPSSNRESSIVSSRRDHIERRNLSENNNTTMATGVAKPKYYLGEDPYLSIYGKENKYDGTQRAQRYQSRRQRSEDVDAYNSNRHQSSNTLGRFSKSVNRLQTSPSDLDYDYRSAQTLPRKLEHKPMHSSAINIAIVNNVRTPSTSQGPAKPARTYKSINRSKSFNVHGLNGTNNPSPIYMEKLNRNISHHYRSNPHLNDDKGQLRSPSIVNLISRSQRDLSKIDENGFGSSNPISASTYDVRRNGYQRNYSPIHYTRNIPADRRAHSLLRTTSDNYRTEMDTPHRNGHYKYGLERNLQRERESSLGSRSPLTINKDTAAIIRRNSSSTEDYSETYKTTTRSDDPYRPSITNTVHNFTKKSHPAKNGRGPETIETSERKSITTSRYRNGDAYSNNLRYVPDRGIRKNSASPVVIEVRRK